VPHWYNFIKSYNTKLKFTFFLIQRSLGRELRSYTILVTGPFRQLRNGKNWGVSIKRTRINLTGIYNSGVWW